MKKKQLENRIKELELELSNKNASTFDVQKSHQSEQRFRNLVELSIYPILILKGEDMIMEIANDPILKIFNVGKEALGKPFLDILPEMKDQPFIGLLLDVLRNYTTHYGTEQPAYFVRENGEKEIIYLNFVYNPYKENDGTVSGVIVYATDVTEQVLARKKVEESEQRFRLATEASGVGIWEWNVITNQIKWDAKMFEIYGVKPTNNGFVQYDTWKEAVVPEDIEEQEKILQDTVKNSSSSKRSFKILRADDGILRHIEAVETVRTNATGQADWIIGTNMDVTEQVLARKKIEESEHRYHNLVYTSPYMIAIFKGKDTIIEIANDAIIETWGKGKDVFGKSLFEVLPEAAEQGFDKLIQNVYETGEPYHAYETPVTLLRNGKQELMHYNFIYQAQRNVDGEIVGVAILANEVTPQALLKKALAEQREIEHKALKSIEESNTRYHSMLMQSPFAFSIMKGKDMVITLANDLIKEFWGKGKDVEGKTLLEVLPEIKDQPFPEMIEKVYTTGIPVYANEILGKLTYNGQLKHKYFNVVFQPYYEADNSISGVTQIAYDVTEMVLARKKIEESDKRYNMMLMHSPFTFAVLKGKDLVITLANDRVKGVWGKGNDVEGKSLLNLMPELNNTPFPALMDEVIATGIPYHGREVLSPHNIHGHAREEYFNFVFQPYWEADETISGITIIGYDVTEQVIAKRKIEESEKKYRTLLTSIDQGFTLCEIIRNKEGKAIDFYMLEVNPTYEEQTGVSKETVLGKRIIQTFPSLTKWMETYAAVVDNQCPVVNEHYFEDTDRWFENKAYPVGRDKFAVLFRDITERKQYESKLIEAKESAENAAKSKQQFLSNMSHEIRTPLNSILGFTNVLLKTELGEKQKDFVQAIKTSSHSLLVLINDILDLAKVDAGKMTFVKQPFDIHQSIKSMLHTFDLKLKEKNIELVSEYDSEIPAMLLGDSVRLNQIILNLMSNAIKFTNKGKITLSVKLQSEDEENVFIEFTVTDTGIGIADNKIDSIFHLFEQAGITISNSYGGTGLGLAIVKQLVEFQGGSISVSSKIGVGSTFSFILPFGKTTMKIAEEPEILKLDSTIKNLRVLVAEDVTLNQLLIKMILSDFGFEHDIVNNGKIAIEKLQTNTYDIILMDLQMPEMNGFEATEYIRQTMKSNIPIIALTADVTTVDIAKCQEFGMDDYLSKPIDENQLYNKIVALIKKKQ